MSEALAVSGGEEPVVDVLERHDVEVLACVGFQRGEDLSEHLWQWAECPALNNDRLRYRFTNLLQSFLYRTELLICKELGLQLVEKYE